MKNLLFSTMWLYDVLEAQLADAERVRGRHSAFEPRESVLTGVGGQYGE